PRRCGNIPGQTHWQEQLASRHFAFPPDAVILDAHCGDDLGFEQIAPVEDTGWFSRALITLKSGLLKAFLLPDHRRKTSHLPRQGP
ncbi:MAG: hypothetical protein WA635_06070, partial [Gallionella sp.]